MEVVERIHHVDNWGCSFEEVIISQWDAAEYIYVPGESQLIFSDSPSCTWRAAEEAMWNKNYEVAVPLYETFLSEQVLEDDYASQARQYVKFRLALAYAFVEQIHDASTLLDELATETPTTPDMGALIHALKNAYQEQDELTLCTAAYNFFSRYVTPTGLYEGPIGGYVGQTLIDHEMFVYYPSSSNPARSGCDILSIIDNRLTTHTFTLDRSLDEQLNDLGLEVKSALNFDLNEDLQDEWIIQLEAEVGALLFVSNGDQYVWTRTYWPREVGDVGAYSLPAHSGTVLAEIEYDYVPEGPGGPVLLCPDGHDASHLFVVRRLEDDDFRTLFASMVCERDPLDDIIQNEGAELHVWAPIPPEYSGQAVPAIYTWNSETQDYELTTIDGQLVDDSTTLYTSPYEEPIPTRESLISNLDRIFMGCNPECIARLLADFDAVIPTIALSDSSPDILQARYGYAFLLEDSGRTDEALAQYVLIHATAPESIWGQLAVLHFE
jgi:hypothetical protein